MHHPHHLMVLMGEDMAVPDIASGLVKGHLDIGNLTRQCCYHIFWGILDNSIGSSDMPNHLSDDQS